MITIDELKSDGKKINDYAETLSKSMNQIVSFVKIDSFDELKGLQTTLDQLGKVLSFYAKVGKMENDINFARGRLVGVTEICKNILSVTETAQRVSRSIDDVFAAIKTVSHSEEILETLSQIRGIQHKELARIINIDVSTLTGIMDKLAKMKLVESNNIGKFKFYYLSELGQNYKDEKKIQPQMYINELQLQLQKEREKSEALKRENEDLRETRELANKKNKTIKPKYNVTELVDIYRNSNNSKENNKESAESIFSDIFKPKSRTKALSY